MVPRRDRRKILHQTVPLNAYLRSIHAILQASSARSDASPASRLLHLATTMMLVTLLNFHGDHLPRNATDWDTVDPSSSAASVAASLPLVTLSTVSFLSCSETFFLGGLGQHHLVEFEGFIGTGWCSCGEDAEEGKGEKNRELHFG